MEFRKKSKKILNDMSIEDYVTYYEQALIAWNECKLSNDDMYDILDNFSDRAYSMVTFLMGCCQLSSMGYKNIETNLMALKLELDALNVNSMEVDNNLKVIQNDIKHCLQDILDICHISREGLDGTYRKDGEPIISKISEEINLNDRLIDDYKKYCLGEFNGEELDSEELNYIADIDDLSITNDLNITNDLSATNDLGIYIDLGLTDINAEDISCGEINYDITDDIITDDIEEEKYNKFYCRIVDQNLGIDKEFKNLNDLKKYIDKM